VTSDKENKLFLGTPGLVSTAHAPDNKYARWVALRRCQYLDYTRSNGKVTDKLESIWEETAVAQSRNNTSALACRNWGNPRKISVRIASVPAKSRIENLPNISLECYRCADLLSRCRAMAVPYIGRHKERFGLQTRSAIV
jgi:hypothetical protein